jgi:isopenicillin N synthase-like dioxygenase
MAGKITVIVPPLMQDLKTALGSKSTLSLIHYLSPQLSQEHEKCNNAPRVQLANRARRIYPMLDSPIEELKIVDSAHTATSILTLQLVSSVPGYQVFDKKARVWVDVDRTGRSGRDLVVTLGQKAKMFFRSEEMESTPHRVLLQCGRERTSLVFSMDLAL